MQMALPTASNQTPNAIKERPSLSSFSSRNEPILSENFEERGNRIIYFD